MSNWLNSYKFGAPSQTAQQPSPSGVGFNKPMPASSMGMADDLQHLQVSPQEMEYKKQVMQSGAYPLGSTGKLSAAPGFNNPMPAPSFSGPSNLGGISRESEFQRPRQLSEAERIAEIQKIAPGFGSPMQLPGNPMLPTPAGRGNPIQSPYNPFPLPAPTFNARPVMGATQSGAQNLAQMLRRMARQTRAPTKGSTSNRSIL